MPLDNIGISKSSLSEDPVLMVKQKPVALNQTNNSSQQTFAYKAVWAKGYTYCVTHDSSQCCYERVHDGEVGKTEDLSSACTEELES